MPRNVQSFYNTNQGGERQLTDVDRQNANVAWQQYGMDRQQQLALEELNRRQAMQDRQLQSAERLQGTFADRSAAADADRTAGFAHDRDMQGTFGDRSAQAMTLAQMNPGYMRELRAQEEWEGTSGLRGLQNQAKERFAGQVLGSFDGAGGGIQMDPDIMQALALGLLGGDGVAGAYMNQRSHERTLSRREELAAEERQRQREDELYRSNPQLAYQRSMQTAQEAGIDPSGILSPSQQLQQEVGREAALKALQEFTNKDAAIIGFDPGEAQLMNLSRDLVAAYKAEADNPMIGPEVAKQRLWQKISEIWGSNFGQGDYGDWGADQSTALMKELEARIPGLTGGRFD